MSAIFDDAVLDFDINFLNQTTTTNDVASLVAKAEKTKKNCYTLKKRILSTDNLIKKYYNKREQCVSGQKIIASVKEECLQLRLELKKTLETIAKSEQDHSKLKEAYSSLEETCNQYQNSYEAQLSNSNQLQVLLKKKEAIIDATKNQNKLAGKIKINKDLEKKLLSLTKEKDHLLKDLNTLAGLVKKTVGNTELKSKYKSLLKKYVPNEDISESSDVENEVFENSLLSPPASAVQKSLIASPSPSDFDTDYSNEIVSVDTGRGSSLAFSEKCLLSPDYYSTDSPLIGESIENKQRPKVSIATSPIPFEENIVSIVMPSSVERTDIATSPRRLETIDIATSPRRLETFDIATSPCRLETNDVATSPQILEKTDVATSPKMIKCNESENNTDPEYTIIEVDCASAPLSITETDIASPISTCSKIKRQVKVMKLDGEIIIHPPKNCSNTAPNDGRNDDQEDEFLDAEDEEYTLENESLKIQEYNKVPHKSPMHIPDKQCLEVNNSSSSHEETDREIRTILNKMQLNCRALSPISRTPTRTFRMQSPDLPDNCCEVINNAENIESTFETSKQNSVIENYKQDILAIRNINRQEMIAKSQMMVVCEAFLHLLETKECQKTQCFENIIGNVQSLLSSLSTSNSNLKITPPTREKPQHDTSPLISNQSSITKQTQHLLKSPELNKTCQISLPRLPIGKIKELIGKKHTPNYMTRSKRNSATEHNPIDNIEINPSPKKTNH